MENILLEAVRTMTKVALEVEKNKEKFLDIPYMGITGEISAYLAKVAVKTAFRIGGRGIIADTIGGRTIRDMASYRGIKLILAQCYRDIYYERIIPVLWCLCKFSGTQEIC